GTVTSSANPFNLVMNQSNNIQAIFSTDIATNVAGNGRVSLNPASPVAFGTTVTATALPDRGYYFVLWNLAVSGTNNPTTLVVTNPSPAIAALFAASPSL